ncbi:SoxR reducing system RseC family protein [[Clostridium] dakarense]|uniref:SoxR reducing system RseC family protein n=1 Tax=Faecalimicrobium dakarense TaxID=1301100 RepID=UPI0004AFBA00|nr:SoxR reducing system RseC family protein [[Clostridium] dakarense]
MNQQGYIIEIVDEKTAKLKMQRHSACASCGKCVTSSEKKDILVEVENTIGAKIGDHVEVNMENVKVLKATAFAYLIPLMGLLIGTIGTYFILESLGVKSNIEIISAVVGFLTTFICYVVLNKNDNKFKDSKDFIPTITKILT